MLAIDQAPEPSVLEVARALSRGDSLDRALCLLSRWGVLGDEPSNSDLDVWLRAAAPWLSLPSFAGRRLDGVRLQWLAAVTANPHYGDVHLYAGRAGDRDVWVRYAPIPGAVGLLVWDEEVAILDRLRGTPGVVQLVDAGEDGDRAWLAIERPHGGTLERYADRGWGAGEPEATVRRLLCALDDVHAAGIVHGALSYRTVYLDRQGPALDGFDAAAARRLLGPDAPGVSETCAPECAGGTAPTAAADRYGAGCIGWWMVTGRWPFERETDRAARAAHRAAPLPALVPRPGIQASDTLRGLLRRLLSRRPADRAAEPLLTR